MRKKLSHACDVDVVVAVYEFIKSKLRERRMNAQLDEEREVETADGYHFGQFMMAGAISKTCASVIAYPHGECTVTAMCAVVTPLFARGRTNSVASGRQ